MCLVLLQYDIVSMAYCMLRNSDLFLICLLIDDMFWEMKLGLISELRIC